MARSAKRGGGQGQLRIIGGTWRGKKLNFPPSDGLRPTSDRIRETLFNWLAPAIHGARCADLFAGSGALGLEALSRGAGHCDFTETSATALKHIDEHMQNLNAQTRARCHNRQAEQFLHDASEPYDVIFIDPPFRQGLVAGVCTALEDRQLLNPGALVYVETAADEPAPPVPASWELHREKVSGGVAYRLFIAG